MLPIQVSVWRPSCSKGHLPDDLRYRRARFVLPKSKRYLLLRVSLLHGPIPPSKNARIPRILTFRLDQDSGSRPIRTFQRSTVKEDPQKKEGSEHMTRKTGARTAGLTGFPDSTNIPTGKLAAARRRLFLWKPLPANNLRRLRICYWRNPSRRGTLFAPGQWRGGRTSPWRW